MFLANFTADNTELIRTIGVNYSKGCNSVTFSSFINRLIFFIMDQTDNKKEQEFEAYREKMHPVQEEGRSVVPTPKKAVAIAFGIFMIFVYVGVGILLLINFFNWGEDWTGMRYIIGIVLIIYGFFRGYRHFTGTDYYSN